MEERTNQIKVIERVGREQFIELPLSCIETNLLSRRNDPEEDGGGLKESIHRQGLIHPVTVLARPGGKYLLIGGSRRLEACRQLGWTAVPCHVLTVPEDEAGLVSFSENYFRQDRHPVEEARLLAHIKTRTGYSDARLAERMGLVASAVTERLNILALPEEILAEVQDRPDSEIKLTHAVVLSKLMRSGRPDHLERVYELKNKTIGCRLTKTELRGLVRLITEPSGPTNPRTKYDRLPASLQKLLATDRSMTVGMAEFFLAPDQVISGEGDKSQRMRQAAGKSNPQDLEVLILYAVKNHWTVEETKHHFIKQIEKQVDKQVIKDKLGEPPHRQLHEVFSQIADLNQALIFLAPETLLDGVCDHELQQIRQATMNAIDRLQNFLTLLQSAPGQPKTEAPLKLAS